MPSTETTVPDTTVCSTVPSSRAVPSIVTFRDVHLDLEVLAGADGAGVNAVNLGPVPGCDVHGPIDQRGSAMDLLHVALRHPGDVGDLDDLGRSALDGCQGRHEPVDRRRNHALGAVEFDEVLVHPNGSGELDAVRCFEVPCEGHCLLDFGRDESGEWFEGEVHLLRCSVSGFVEAAVLQRS